MNKIDRAAVVPIDDIAPQLWKPGGALLSAIRSLPVLPVAFFGMPLGLLALGNGWRTAARISGAPASIGELVLLAGVALWAIYLLLMAAKWIAYSEVARAEFAHPVQFAFYSLIGVTAVLTAGALLPYARSLAVVIYAVGALYLLALAVWGTGRLWTGDRDPALSLPPLYIPTIAGGFAAATGAAAFGWHELAQLSFGAGFFAWLGLEAAVLHRLMTGPALAPALRPLLGIQLAPPTVGGIAALSVFGPAALPFVYALLGYALFQALVLLRLMPWIREQGFTPMFWSFSFGAASLGALPLRLAEQGAGALISALSFMLFVAANAVVLGLIVATLRIGLAARRPKLLALNSGKPNS